MCSTTTEDKLRLQVIDRLTLIDNRITNDKLRELRRAIAEGKTDTALALVTELLHPE